MTGETLATRIGYATSNGAGAPALIEGRELRIAVARA